MQVSLVALSPQQQVFISWEMQCFFLVRPTSPEVNLTLVSWLTGDPVDMDAAGITLDPARGFVISEGRLRHHSGPMRCEAFRDGIEESVTYRLMFSFSGGGDDGSDGDGDAGGDGGDGGTIPTPVIDQFEVSSYQLFWYLKMVWTVANGMIPWSRMDHD